MGQDINSHDTQADPHSQQASTTGLVVAGFGLSAFFFTTLSNTFSKSTTSMFLLILALGTSSLMVLGVFLVHPIPQPEQYTSQSLEDGDDTQETLLPALQRHNHSCTPLLNDDSTKNRHYTRSDTNTDAQSSNCAGAVHPIQASDRRTSALNVHGKALLHNLDFWLLFSIYSMRMYAFLLPLLLFLINVLYKMDSRRDWVYMYVLDLPKMPTEVILPPFV